MSVLFERFISRERNEAPDIDVDFENSRREEVMQYLYQRYGRQRAALTATVITYRSRSAFRDVAKALGFSLDEAAELAAQNHWWDDPDAAPARFEQMGLDVNGLHMQQLIKLTAELRSFPRHLSQHTGGFVLTGELLSRTVPIENASMKDRTVLEWDKDDLDALGILKIDVLALGMLTAIRMALEFVGERKRPPLRAAGHPRRVPGGLQDAVQRRQRRDVSGRVARPAVNAAASKAALLLRPGHRSGVSKTWPHRRQRGAPLLGPSARQGAGELPPARR